jgi:hypothetical protein
MSFEGISIFIILTGLAIFGVVVRYVFASMAAYVRSRIQTGSRRNQWSDLLRRRRRQSRAYPGDGDGIVVINPDDAPALLEKVKAKVKKELETREAIKADTWNRSAYTEEALKKAGCEIINAAHPC